MCASYDVNQCAIVYEDDTDFSDLEVVPPVQKQREIIPSQEIDQTKFSHLTDTQRNELLAILIDTQTVSQKRRDFATS